MNFGDGESQLVEFSPGLPNHGAFFFRTYQARLVLEPVVRPREHGAPLVPDDLLVVQKPDSQQAIEHLQSIRAEVQAAGPSLTGRVWITSLSIWWLQSPDSISEYWIETR